ncbi:EMYY motif lipoprotein [Staphylococcus cornubiensis]|uniref:EMYY motif lipoprotein n=1 Tax=Staphylococcus cornubiensis TaxID=1986155 RepID=UPI000A3CEADF|nr:EMYY motif lipoprotein [Staphylococcus cornubiensis]
MKKWVKMIILSFLIIGSLTACMESSEKQMHAFDKQMMTVTKKERIVNQILEKMNLNQLYDLSQTDTTDANKKAFDQMKAQIDNKLKPAMREYHEAAKALPEENKNLKALKSTYLEGIAGKEEVIEKLDQFVVLCQDSIQANENILEFTQQFEKYRSRVESQMSSAKQTTQGVEDSAKLEAQLDENNSRIKDKAETSIREKDGKDQMKAIQDEIIPLVQAQIKDLNEMQLRDDTTNRARQNAVQMYYSLERYYQERVKTIEYNQKLAEMSVRKLITKAKDLDSYNEAYENQRDQLNSN